MIPNDSPNVNSEAQPQPFPYDAPSPTAVLQQILADWTSRIQPGRDALVVGWNVDQLLGTLALEEGLSETVFDEVCAQINGCLKGHGLGAIPKRSLLAKLKRAKPSGRADGTTDAELFSRYAPLSGLEGAPEGTLRYGIADRLNDGKLILNAEPTVNEILEFIEGDERRVVFRGQIRCPGGDVKPWRIGAEAYASDREFMASLYGVVGTSLIAEGKASQIRNAVPQISGGPPARHPRTIDFGWTEDFSAYLVRSGRITAAGLQPYAPGDLQVDLSDYKRAQFLDMKQLGAEALVRVKTHLCEDFLRLHDRSVTHSLLGTMAAAILAPFAEMTQRYALWLLGGTGDGKTTIASLASNFFGDFPTENTGGGSRFMTCGATTNAIEFEGHFYRHATYLVDDYKSATAQNRLFVALIQRYGDGTARERLRSDATPSNSRPIRGLLIVTGENRLDNESSTTARTVIIPVAPCPKDPDRLDRCSRERPNYRGVTADFISWLLRHGKTKEVRGHVQAYRRRFIEAIRNNPNSDRIANNVALLAAAHQLVCEFFAETVPSIAQEAYRYREEDLPRLLKGMANEVRQQRPVEVFWDTLCELIQADRVQIDRLCSDNHAPVIGRKEVSRSGVAWIFPGLALGAVQMQLRDQGRETLSLEKSEIARLLHQEGKLADLDGNPLPAGVGATKPQRHPTGNVERCFLVRLADLMGEEDPHSLWGRTSSRQPISPPLPLGGHNNGAHGGTSPAYASSATARH